MIASQLWLYLRYADINLVYLVFNLTLNFLKQACNTSGGLSQRSVLKYIVIFYMKKHFGVYLLCIAALHHVRNCSEFHFTLTQKFHRLGYVDECLC